MSQLHVRNAKQILQQSELLESNAAKALKYSSASKDDRKAVIHGNPASDDAALCAAIEIQRVFRGYCARCQLLNTIVPKASKTAIYGESQLQLRRLHDVASPILEKTGQRTTNHMEGQCENYMQEVKKSIQELPSMLDDKNLPEAATVELEAITRDEKSSKKRDQVLTQPEAACIIQRAWRRHIDVQVFRYYRDLINFKNRGDPMMMLRCINPNEAKLLDAASGIHVKFRLAGERFPPNIYYKIFTHRPVQDMCANSPKDYTKADTKRSMARDVHNKGNRLHTQMNERQGWYERRENNGWRLVSDRLIQHVLSDPITWHTSKVKVDFHHNKLQRKQELEKRKKKKKIEWMQKMYREGMMKAKVDDEETVKLIEGATAGMVSTIEKHGPEIVQDWEVDELLDWTTSLNFEDYWKCWKETATSANSEKPVYERLKLHTSEGDPYAIAIKTNQRENSARPSHNTPVSSQSAGSMIQNY